MNWPQTVRNAMRRHVRGALERLDPERYFQEPAYVAALLARLDGVVYRGSAGRVEIRSTIVADRGPNSAESQWGADFGIVAILRDPTERVQKGVLAQAKKGSLPDLSEGERRTFLSQCARMSNATSAILCLEIPVRFAEPVIVREIEVRRPIRALRFDDAPWHPPTTIGVPQELADYLVERFLLCGHGDHNPGLIHGIGDSKLSHLLVLGESAD